MGKRLSTLLILVVGVLTAFAFTAGSGLAQTGSTSTTGGTGTAGSPTAAATATRAATVAPTVAATVAPTVARTSAVATGTGGATTTTTLPATGQPQKRSSNFLLIEMMVLGLAVVATGVALKRRGSRN